MCNCGGRARAVDRWEGDVQRDRKAQKGREGGGARWRGGSARSLGRGRERPVGIGWHSVPKRPVGRGLQEEALHDVGPRSRCLRRTRTRFLVMFSWMKTKGVASINLRKRVRVVKNPRAEHVSCALTIVQAHVRPRIYSGRAMGPEWDLWRGKRAATLGHFGRAHQPMLVVNRKRGVTPSHDRRRAHGATPSGLGAPSMGNNPEGTGGSGKRFQMQRPPCTDPPRGFVWLLFYFHFCDQNCLLLRFGRIS